MDGSMLTHLTPEIIQRILKMLRVFAGITDGTESSDAIAECAFPSGWDKQDRERRSVELAIVKQIGALTDLQRQELVAVFLVGRDAIIWEDATQQANSGAHEYFGQKLLGNRNNGDYIEAGLATLGFNY